MGDAEATVELESALDPAYPTTTPPDAIYPCQTRAPVGPPLDGVAVPAIWSRLARPLERALNTLWESGGLPRRNRVAQPVAIHYGRIALNAHGWERLRARAVGEPADPALLGPPGRGLQRWIDQFESVRARSSLRRLHARLQQIEGESQQLIRRAAEVDPAQLDTQMVARGPLHEGAWTSMLLPWLGLRLWGESTAAPDAVVRAGVVLEQRFAAELGRRLVQSGVLDEPAGVAYLTVEERIRAVHEPSPYWVRLAEERRARVEEFVRIDVPVQFWGRPRVEWDKTG